MAKYKQETIGSVLKNKEGGFYIKLLDDARKGTYTLRKPKEEAKKLEQMREEGKIEGDWVQKAIDRYNNIPEFVMFEIVKLTKKEE